jgi:hypothetical protein
MDHVIDAIRRNEKRLRFLLLLTLGAIHLALAGVMAWWALVLLSSEATFGTGISYDWLEHHWPFTQHGWGVAFVVAAGIGIVGMVPPRRVVFGCRTILVRETSAGLLCGAHWTLAWATFASNHGAPGGPLGTGTGAYGIYAGLALFRMIMEAIV